MGISFSLVCFSILCASPGNERCFQLIMDTLTKKRVKDARLGCSTGIQYKKLQNNSNFEIVSCHTFKCNPLFAALVDKNATTVSLNIVRGRENRKLEEATRLGMITQLLNVGFSLKAPWCFSDYLDLGRLIVYKSAQLSNTRRNWNLTNYMNKYVSLCQPTAMRPSVVNILTFAILNFDDEDILLKIINLLIKRKAKNEILSCNDIISPCCRKNHKVKGKQFPLLNALISRMFYFQSTKFILDSTSQKLLNAILPLIDICHRTENSLYISPDIFVLASYTGCLSILRLAFEQITFLYEKIAANWLLMYKKSLVSGNDRDKTYIHVRLAIALCAELLLFYHVPNGTYYTVMRNLYFATKTKTRFIERSNVHVEYVDPQHTESDSRWEKVFDKIQTNMKITCSLQMLCRQSIRTALAQHKQSVLYSSLISDLPCYVRKYDENGNIECIMTYTLPPTIKQYLVYSRNQESDRAVEIDSCISRSGWLIDDSVNLVV
jgi:SOCS box